MQFCNQKVPSDLRHPPPPPKKKITQKNKKMKKPKAFTYICLVFNNLVCLYLY